MAGRKKPLVVLTRKLPDTVEKRMGELFNVRLAEDRPIERRELLAAMREADVLVPTISEQIDAALIAEAGPALKLIANFGNGTDHIDTAAAAQRNIMVTNTPNVLTEDTADMTMALILAVSRRLVEGANSLTHTGNWSGWSPNWMLGHRIRGKHIGIIGMGRIGMALARRAKAFGLTVHYHNRQRVSPKIEEQLEAIYWGSLDQMLAQMDIISINCPATRATFHLLSAERLALLKPTAYLVNTARGEIVDENALIGRLEQSALAGAGLDVFEKAPQINPRLLELARQGKAVLSPHIASATLESRIEMGERVIINIRTFFDHHRPPDRIIPTKA